MNRDLELYLEAEKQMVFEKIHFRDLECPSCKQDIKAVIIKTEYTARKQILSLSCPLCKFEFTIKERKDFV